MTLNTLHFELCDKQKQFLNAGNKHKYRHLIADNATGKTSIILYELNAHLTGDYPSWWQGVILTHPTTISVVVVVLDNCKKNIMASELPNKSIHKLNIMSCSHLGLNTIKTVMPTTQFWVIDECFELLPIDITAEMLGRGQHIMRVESLVDRYLQIMKHSDCPYINLTELSDFATLSKMIDALSRRELYEY